MDQEVKHLLFKLEVEFKPQSHKEKKQSGGGEEKQKTEDLIPYAERKRIINFNNTLKQN
jgi:hypothetical protein